jgi:hypothetical protein
VYTQAGNEWRGIVPSFVNDDLYYYARMQNIEHGYPSIGNPYFYEHRNEISPTSFLPDWISAVPLFFSISFPYAILFNFIFWSVVTTLLLYVLFRKLHISENISYVGAFITYCFLYMLILRPVAMQIAYPFFILFCIAYFIWLSVEKTTYKEDAFLAVTVGASFYIYSYSWQLVLAIFGLTGLFYIYNKNWSKLKNLIGVLCASFILALPDIFYTLKQLAHPYFWETMVRINLVNSRLPTALSFYDSGVVILIVLLWYVFSWWVKDFPERKDGIDRSVYMFVYIVGVALIVALFSNVVTGKDFEVSNHFDRYVLVWMSISLITITYFAWKSRKEIQSQQLYKKVSLCVLFLVSFGIYANSFSQGFNLLDIMHTDTVSAQVYGAPLDWLNMNVPKESVIWSDADIGSYIPIQTDDFQLFNPAGGLHLVSDKEVEERYLVSSYFDNLSVLDIERDFRLYAGVGNAVHDYKTYNRKVRLCQIFGLSHFGVACGEVTDAVSFKGEAYFVALYNQYKNTIKPNIYIELKKFNVRYIVKDKRIEDGFAPEKLLNTKLLWSNTDFAIYSLN